jgi:hypothetical protein
MIVVVAVFALCVVSMPQVADAQELRNVRRNGLQAERTWVRHGVSAMPPQYYTNYWTAVGMSIETIDVVRGVGVPFLDDVILDEYPGKGFTAGLGLTFDVDGSVYILNNWLAWDNPYLSELTTIDLDTGVTSVIAEINNHFSGSEMDACGNLYTVGFQAPPPNDGFYFSPLYGDKLCRINKYTGEVTPIGTGTGLPDVMDLAFDSKGTLWATTQNKLYTISLDDGSATEVAEITNVPMAPPGETNPMMIMSIAFDKHDVLYRTAIVGIRVTDYTVTPIMRIDTETGEGTLLDTVNWDTTAVATPCRPTSGWPTRIAAGNTVAPRSI